MKQYKEGDKVVLDFSRCDPSNSDTPDGLFFPREWRKYLQGKTVTIDTVYISINSHRRYRTEEMFECAGGTQLWFDEFCILDPRSVFDISGLEELI